jgi:hypothetical protein
MEYYTTGSEIFFIYMKNITMRYFLRNMTVTILLLRKMTTIGTSIYLGKRYSSDLGTGE